MTKSDQSRLTHRRLIAHFEKLGAKTVFCDLCAKPREFDLKGSLRWSVEDGRERVIYRPCSCHEQV